MADIAVRSVQETNRTLSGFGVTSDGVMLADGDYVLCTGQSSNIQNGVWVARSGTWERPLEGIDYRKGFEARVLEGSSHELAEFVQTSTGVLVGTDPLTFRKENLGRVLVGSGGIAINGYEVSLQPSGVTEGTYELAALTIEPDGRVSRAEGIAITSSFMEGLTLNYVDDTTFQLGVGSAYIPGNRRVIRVSTPLTGEKMAGNSFPTYVYLYETNGAGQLETSSTPPSAPYADQARTKTGDDTRRYVGMLKNSSTGVLLPFTYEVLSGNLYKFKYAQEPSLLRIQNAYTGTTTTQSMIIGQAQATIGFRLVPVGTLSAFIYWETTGAGFKYLGYPPVSTMNPPLQLPAAGRGENWIDLGPTEDVKWKMVTSTDTISLSVSAYIGRR